MSEQFIDVNVSKKLTVGNGANQIEMTEGNVNVSKGNVNVSNELYVGNGANQIEMTGGRIKYNGKLLFQNRNEGEGDMEVAVDGVLSAEAHLTCRKNIKSDEGDIIANEGDIIAKNGVVKANDVLINSSIDLKQDISTLTKEEAYNLIEDLEPVKFSFKNDPSKKENIGFIAEKVPPIIADDPNNKKKC